MRSARFGGGAAAAREGIFLHSAGGGPKCRAVVNTDLTARNEEA